MSQIEKKPTLEETFESIENILEKMEQPEVTLEESFALYQNGIERLKNCNEILDQVEKKMQVINAEGELQEF